MQMSITRSLNEVKLLEKRINDKIRNTQFIISNKKSNKKINGAITIDEFNKNAKANYDSIVDLINRKKLIKTLIVESNARTKITIGDKEYSVADAIERKNSIELDKMLLDTMKAQYRNELSKVTLQNEKMEENLDRQLETMLGSDNRKTDGAEVYAKSYRENNFYELVDGLNLKDKIENLQLEIDEFESNVDFVLSESNALTKIEIPE